MVAERRPASPSATPVVQRPGEAAPTHWTRVAAAVISRPDGHVLLAQRPSGKAYAGYWEFPGGKLEPGETPHHALARELREELGLEVTRADPWLTCRYVYPHASVELHFFRVAGWSGEPFGHDGQAFAWQLPGAFAVAPLLPANTAVLRALALPQVMGITCASEVGVDRFLERARRAFERGLRLVQVREKPMPAAQLAELVGRLREATQGRDVRFVLNGDAGSARRLGCDGVHWTGAALRGADHRPDVALCGASCHDRDELDRAITLGLDYALLGPVRETPTHPGLPGMGWECFAAIAQPTPLPVFALGGLTAGDLDAATSMGAHGIAMIRGAWGP